MNSSGDFSRFDRLLAYGLSLALALAAFFSGAGDVIPPGLWDGISVAAGIRPPQHEFPLLWHRFVSVLVGRFGIAEAVRIITVLGPVSLGLLSFVACRLFAACLPGALRRWGIGRGRGRWVVRWTVALATVLFVCSDPVWRAGSVFSPEMLLLLLSVCAVFLAVSAFDRSSALCIVLTGAVSGILAAETPLGFLPPLCLALHVRFRDWRPVGTVPSSIANPLVHTVAVRWMTLAFIGCWVTASVLNLSFYRQYGGAGSDEGAFIGIVGFFVNYLTILRSAMTPFGWILTGMAVVAPVTFSVARMVRAFDTEWFLPLRYGFFFIIAGVFASLQSSIFSSCWFWSWIDAQEPVASSYLLCLCMLGTSFTAFSALCVMAVDVYLRNYRRIARENFGPAAEEGPVALRILLAFRRSSAFLRPTLFATVPLMVLVIALPRIFDDAGRKTAEAIDLFVRHTAEECGDAPYLFTDGSLDTAIETVAAVNGRRLKTLSMMSGSSQYDVAVRTTGITNAEDRALLTVGAAETLRAWVREGAPCSSNLAVQIGFELWRHDRRPMPECGGFVARTAGFEPGMAGRGAELARDLSERIISLREDGDIDRAGPASIRSALSFVQWRLSRMCRLRADAADVRGDTAASAAEHALADRLDAANPDWRKVQEMMDWLVRRDGMRLTPREGLALGLSRANFRLARSYARQVLVSDPDDLRANFAMGMSCLAERQYGRAEHFLKRAREKNPDEPAILNNLAVVLLRLDRLAEAETNAVRALRAFPTSPEIKETLRRIRQELGKNGPVSTTRK